MLPEQAPLKVIALVSGGKDSFFALLHCLAQGHSVVALANLYPEPAESDNDEDLNSYMYQTAGHALIPSYAQLLPFPLYRQAITGTAKDQAREYAHVTGDASSTGLDLDQDETESLLPLLRRVLAAHPDANALCSGAILSTYQRTRVESVCSRLGLISLAYLWQYPVLPRAIPPYEDTGHPSAPAPPDALLQDIAAAGLDARIVKVASAGLDDSFLWQSLADPKVQNRVSRAVGRFGGSVLGEGGEFETLVISGPSSLWKGRLEVDDEEKTIVEGGGGEALLAFSGGKVLAHDSRSMTQDVKELVRKPTLWDPRFFALLTVLESEFAGDKTSKPDACSTATSKTWRLRSHVTRANRSLHISNLMCLNTTTVESQMHSISHELQAILTDHSLRSSDIVFTTILLRSIDDFAGVNKIYSKLFSEPIPPARVTVAIGDAMPPGVHVLFSITASLVPRTERRGLHVQSRSYWAPANIGPYSQAVSINLGNNSTNALVYVAGQIPLVPSTMEILRPPGLTEWTTFVRQAVLSAQHLWRIGLEMEVSWWTSAVVYLASHTDCVARVRVANQIWRNLHKRPEDDTAEESGFDGPDLWDQRHGGMGSYVTNELEKSPIPNYASLKNSTKANITPCFLAVEVQDTPRKCSIEWQSLGMVGNGLEYMVQDKSSGLCTNTTQHSTTTVYFHKVDAAAADQEVHAQLQEYGLWDSEQSEGNETLTPVTNHATLYTVRPGNYTSVKAQIIPCSRLWTDDAQELQAALVVVVET